MVKKNTQESIDLADLSDEERQAEKDRRRKAAGLPMSTDLEIQDVQSSQESPDA